MALEDDIKTLSATPLLDELGRDALRLIAFSADRIRLKAGQTLFEEGDEADAGFVVASGAISLKRGDAEKVVGRSALIGELALLADVTRPVTATAKEPSEVIRIARTLFARLFDEYPDLARNLHARIAQRVRANVTELKTIEALLRK